MAREQPQIEAQEFEMGRPRSIGELSTAAATDLWVGPKRCGQGNRGGFPGGMEVLRARCRHEEEQRWTWQSLTVGYRREDRLGKYVGDRKHKA